MNVRASRITLRQDVFELIQLLNGATTLHRTKTSILFYCARAVYRYIAYVFLVVLNAVQKQPQVPPLSICPRMMARKRSN